MENRNSSIQFIAANCPNCGGELRVPENRAQVKCMYCGYDIIIHDPNKISVEVKANTTNLLSLASVAEESGNYEESFSYYSRILEEDPNNWNAWLGKAISAGMLSTIDNFRISEMADLYHQGLLAVIDSLLKENVIAFVNTAHPKMFAVLTAAQKYSLDYFKKYIQDDEVWKNYKLRCVDIKRAIDVILTFPLNSPVVPDVLSLGITITKELIEGWNYTEVGALGESVRRVTGNFKGTILSDFNKYVDQMKSINPQYMPPKLQEKKEHCFIATATMGSYDHPYVISLRKFRDSVLLKSNFGAKIVDVYYQKSPFVARVIAKSSFLRKVSLWLVVKPWVWFAETIENHNS